ncbi:hypothetical protein NliqN6_3299 [Naganishia liquefaciens]|uniref:Uncharacterized protein n=1 Tax=Naganishia liquefaciens TaxID=104408 RepID=A0A8H3TTI0_9TREE|nr:hypothetical protein NliqN6_3299 [Naganishia liquefaciens]
MSGKNDMHYQNVCHPVASPANRLALEFLEVITGDLIVRDWHRTCSSLSMVSTAVKEQVNSILWKRVVYRWINTKKKSKTPVAWKHTFTADIMKTSYLSIRSLFKSKAPAGTYIIDESAGSIRVDWAPSNVGINPFSSGGGVQGFVQYLAVAPGITETVRAILGPTAKQPT